MSSVSPKRLGDILNLKRGYDLPENRRIPGPYPVISSSGISGYHNEFKKSGEGVITGRYGTLGEVYYIDGEYWPHNTALYITDFKGNYPKYIYYLLKVLGRIRTSDKSAVPGVNRTELHEMKVPVAESSTAQTKIAAVLSAHDAKIDLNNRINAELEAMARTLYDYWFVQFDFPDENGNPYKSSGGKMVYDPVLKREIPEGWDARNITALSEVEGGGTPAKSDPSFWNGDIPFFTPTDADSTVFRYSTADSITDRGLAKSSTRLFPQGTIFVTARGSVGKLSIAGRPMAMNQSCYALRPKPGVGHGLLFFVAKELIRHLSVKSSGSVFDSIVSSDIEHTFLAIPPMKVAGGFSTVVGPIFDRIAINTKENFTLSELRDWLLPMLMNGQVTLE